MKGEEYVEQNNNNNGSNTSMFLHHHKFQNPLQQTHPFQLSREEDDTKSSSAPPAASKKSRPSEGNGGGDGASIEVVRRPRGRPPGSKNKPKPPVIITREPEPAMSPYVLEISGGNDVVEVLSQFSRRRNVGLCVLTGSGTVANVTLRQPSTNPGATVTFHGRFDILSISATFLPQTMSYNLPSSANGFTISLAGPQGQIVGGAVAGSLLAAGTVFVIAASFNNPAYHRLPGEETSNSASGNEGHSPPTKVSGGDAGHPPHQGESSGISMYSCHLPSDVIWAPTARQPQPPPPPPY